MLAVVDSWKIWLLVSESVHEIAVDKKEKQTNGKENGII